MLLCMICDEFGGESGCPQLIFNSWLFPLHHNFSSPDNEFNSHTCVLNQNINLGVFPLLLWGFMGRNAVVKNL